MRTTTVERSLARHLFELEHAKALESPCPEFWVERPEFGHLEQHVHYFCPGLCASLLGYFAPGKIGTYHRLPHVDRRREPWVATILWVEQVESNVRPRAQHPRIGHESEVYAILESDPLQSVYHHHLSLPLFILLLLLFIFFVFFSSSCFFFYSSSFSAVRRTMMAVAMRATVVVIVTTSTVTIIANGIKSRRQFGRNV